LRYILPDLDSLRGISQLPGHRDDAFVHTLKVVDAIAPMPVRRWAALLHDIGKAPTFIETPEGRSRFFEHDRIGAEMVPEIMGEVGEPQWLIDDVQQLVRLHMRPISYTPEWTHGAVRRLVEEAEEGRGPEGWYDLLALSNADLRGYLPEPIDRGVWTLQSLEARWRAIQDAEREDSHSESEQPRSPLDGHEIVALAGREPGPWVADAKAYLVAEVASGRLDPDDKDGVRSLLRTWLAT
jgi:poly(A) polymerase